MVNLRFEAVAEAFKKRPLESMTTKERPSEYFAKKVFNRQKMYKYLPLHVYEKLTDVIDNGTQLDRSIADDVAAGMKQWAMENGVTHYTHWFQPLTEGTAEKHDAFVEHDGKGGMIEEFSGKLLAQQEPDASSFPNGGIRNTFEARGYSAWDPTSPVFIIDDTLCIPTIFISYTGEALDYKAPLLRSLHAVNVAATAVCHYFNKNVKKVSANLGWEQEYFLVDEDLYSTRPDLMLTGRTLMGHDSAKNQQMDDHYFGTIRVLLHEKPFDGINGSGKHNNWSLTTDTGILLHRSGKTAEDNLRFVVFIVETLMAVYRHNGLLKASVMSATNDHRLGANEAPPAIISSFLGKQLTDLLDHIELADKKDLFTVAGKKGMKLDIPEIPELLIDNTDRNRTSPFAFTGNRFEFRAVGSEANCASAMIVLNAAVAEALTDFKQRVDALIAKGEDQNSAIIDVIREDIKTCKPIRFDGNGYSDEWKEEAKSRGLDCEASCPVCFDRYLDEDSVRMFESTGVMTRNELEARNEVKWETYTKKIQIEARVMGDLVMNHIVPVATHYQSHLAKNVQSMIDIFGREEGKQLTERNIKIIKEIADRTQIIETGVEELVNSRKVANRIEDAREKAIAYHDTIAPKMSDIRYQVDKLELVVSDELWTLPKYRELLFIR